MSTLLYAARTAKHQEAPAQKAEGRSKYVDAVAAIVPAEVLAAHAVIVGVCATTKEVAGSDRLVTTVTEPGWLAVSFWGLLALSVLLFLGPKLSDGSITKLDPLRALLVAAAFVVWSVLQPGTAFDAAFGPVSEVGRFVIGILAAVPIAAAASWLSVKAIEDDPPVAERPVIGADTDVALG